MRPVRNTTRERKCVIECPVDVRYVSSGTQAVLAIECPVGVR